jgi:hypothetical protein
MGSYLLFIFIFSLSLLKCLDVDLRFVIFPPLQSSSATFVVSYCKFLNLASKLYKYEGSSGAKKRAQIDTAQQGWPYLLDVKASCDNFQMFREPEKRELDKQNLLCNILYSVQLLLCNDGEIGG